MTRRGKTGVLLLVLSLVVVFICSFVVLRRTQSIAPHIYGIEGYYHMGVARMIRSDGIVRDFPWMQYSTPLPVATWTKPPTGSRARG